MTKENKKAELIKLFGYLHDIQLSEKACVFMDYSGHVNWLDITLAESGKKWRDNFYQTKFYLDVYDVEVIQDIRKEIKEALGRIKETRKHFKEVEEKHEKEELARLKAKYEK